MTPGTEPTRTQTVRTRLADLWSHRRRIAAALLATAVLWGGFAAYQRHLAVTRVAFVNFPGFQLARIERARQSAAVRVESLDMASLDRVADYPVAYVFGRGLRAAGVDDAVNLYHDLASGVRDDRPGLDSCLRALPEGRRARRLEARPPRPQPSPTWSTPCRTCRPAG